MTLAGRTDYEAGGYCFIACFFSVSCKPAGLIRSINLSGLYLSAGSLLQRLLLSSNLDAALHQCLPTPRIQALLVFTAPFLRSTVRTPTSVI